MNPHLTTFTARSPQDLVALVPILIGFAPADSLVMLTLAGPRQFHARIDLPDDDRHVGDVAHALIAPAVQHAASAVAFVVYTDDERLAKVLGREVEHQCRDAQIGVLDVIRVAGGRWFSRSGPRWGVPFDPSAHPFTAQAVLEGRAVLGSREELAASVAPDPVAAGAVSQAMPGVSTEIVDPSEFSRWLGTRDAVSLSAEDVARILHAVQDPVVRNAVWAGLDRQQCGEAVEVWAAVLRRAPASEPLATALVAGLTGMLAWRAGNGALAWCALDREKATGCRTSLVGLVGDLLETAADPAMLDRVSPTCAEDGPNSGRRR
ncbi:MAG: DUF4192 domain-containing protein [Nocardioides sp.]